ncbi:MAG: phenylacetate--CoA ligase family protein [Deltaproteobacteria bacterium]|nr:phenylacetate--CoA ligase family protein [Deltaproteobacteria bacterium]
MGLLRTIFYCLRLRRHDKQSLARIEEQQALRLQEVVRFAKERSPYYRDLYKDVDPDSPGFSVRDLPTTNKSELMARFDEVVTDPSLKMDAIMDWTRDPGQVGRWYLRRFVPTLTSGTTGAPGLFVFNRKEWDWIQALSVTRGIRFKPSFFKFFAYAARILVRRVRVALISVLNGHFITYVLFRMTPRIGRLLSRFEFLSVVEPLPKLVERLNRIQPNILHCYPTMLEVLAFEQLEGRLSIKPWVISSSSEPLTRRAREVIGKAFPESPLFETYGTSEGVALASECHLHRGLHINSDYFILEPVTNDGDPVEPGQSADKLFLTCLFAQTMPIIRYEVSDATTPLGGSCPCGSPFPLIKVQGRTDDTFWVRDDKGRPVALPPIPFEALFLNVQGLVQYQLVQQKRDVFLVRFRVRRTVDEAVVAGEIRQHMEAYLEEKGLGGRVQLRIEVVAEIPRDPKSGKIRQIQSLVEQLYIPGTPLADRRSGEDRRTDRELDEDTDERRLDRRRMDEPGEETDEG